MTREPSIDWSSVERDTVRLLQELIRIDTSNPPGDEHEAAELLQRFLVADAIPTRRYDMAPRRANLAARVPGRGDEPPLLLMTHLDVVPAGEGWRHPPFGGVEADGQIWGRGAIDMKHIVAAMAVALRLAVRCGMPFRRDLILIATADEETAGETGAEWLFREHPDAVDAEIAVSEGGDSLQYGSEHFLLITTAEKGWGTLGIRRTSPPGHSSLPTNANSLVDVARFATRLGERRFPHRVTSVVRELIEGVAATQPEPERSRLLALLRADDFDDALSSLNCDDAMKTHLTAMLHSHASPTVIASGKSAFTIPEEALLTISARLLPDEPVDAWIRDLEAIAGPLGDHTRSEFQTGAEFARGPFYDVLGEIAVRHCPGMHVLPTLNPGGGDLRHASAAGLQAYGFFPLPLSPHGESLMTLAHARDERIRPEHVALCVRYAWDVLCRASGLSEWQAPPLGLAATADRGD